MSHSLTKHLLAATALTFVLSVAAATAGELPTYDVSSFPATPVQLSVLGASRAQQQSPVATLTRNDMPATPVQLSVLTSHHHRSASAETTSTVGTARN